MTQQKITSTLNLILHKNNNKTRNKILILHITSFTSVQPLTKCSDQFENFEDNSNQPCASNMWIFFKRGNAHFPLRKPTTLKQFLSVLSLFAILSALDSLELFGPIFFKYYVRFVKEMQNVISYLIMWVKFDILLHKLCSNFCTK